MEKPANKKGIFIIVLTCVIVILIGVSIYFIRQSKKTQNEMNEIVEMMNFEKEQLEREYSNLNLEFDNYPMNIQNDSLVKLLDDEKAKVQQLLDELRITKSTNRKRIAELEKELSTVRTVMVSYITQIDSLNRVNTRLENENRQVRQQYNVASQKVETLSKEKETLEETVSRASKLEVTGISFTPLNEKGRSTKRSSNMANFQFNYTVSKNITTLPGMKTLYLRLTRPDGEVLTKNESNVFRFEDKDIAYSASKEFEYEGEALSGVIYWKVEEIIQLGNYRADFFIDGNQVGSYKFEISK